MSHTPERERELRLARQNRRQCVQCWRPRHPESFALCYVHLLKDRLRKRKTQGYKGKRGRPVIQPLTETEWQLAINQLEAHAANAIETR